MSLSGDEQIHIQYSENSKEYYHISVSDEQVLTMESASNKEWKDYIGGKASAEDRTIVLQIPDALLDSFTLSTTNEDISLPALAVTGSINISSNGGNISFENLDVGSALTLAVKNGNISGAIAGSYDDFAIQSEIKKGESNLPGNKEEGEKTLNVSANNGDIDITFQNERHMAPTVGNGGPKVPIDAQQAICLCLPARRPQVETLPLTSQKVRGFSRTNGLSFQAGCKAGRRMSGVPRLIRGQGAGVFQRWDVVFLHGAW